jgi:hypothetical protein
VSTVTDISGLVAMEAQAPAPAPVTETPVVDKPTVDVGSDLPKAPPADKVEAKADETKPEAAKVDDKGAVSTKPQVLAQSVHEALKAFMGENPTAEGKAKLQEINKAVGQLYKQVAEAREDSANVREISTAAQELSTTVEATDQLLYNSHDSASAKELIQNIWDDVNANSTPQAYEGFCSAAIERLKESHPEAYYKNVIAPVYQDSLQQTGMVDAVRGLINAFNAGDQRAMRTVISNIAKHVEEIRGLGEKHKTESATAKLTADKTQAAEAYRTERMAVCDKTMNEQLGGAFKPILNSTTLGQQPHEAQLAVAREIRSNALKAMNADKTYVKLINDAFNSRNTVEVERLYRTKMSHVKDKAVQDAISRLYPNGLEKRAAVAPKGTCADFKEGRFLMVKSKPADLDMARKNAGTLSIAGRGYRKDGSAVCWRRN